MKTSVTLSIDVETYAKARSTYKNLSAKVNDLLEASLGEELRTPRTEEELASELDKANSIAASLSAKLNAAKESREKKEKETTWIR